MILRLHHIGLVVESLDKAVADYEKIFGFKATDFRNDQGKGFQLDARIMLPNQCWLHLVQNWNPESPRESILAGSRREPGAYCS